MMYDKNSALKLLRTGTGMPHAQFREGQEDAIRHVVEGQGKLLVVQKTGWGKSFVYFIATRLLREAGAGPALLISPLLSLMRNQIAAAERMGLQAASINSENRQDHPIVKSRLYRDEVDILLVAPERLANHDFRDRILPNIGDRLSLLIVDEAHCISDWGHDFRPDYRLIMRMTQRLPKNIRMLATTATANDRVMEDLINVYGPDIKTLRGELSRPSLLLQTIRMPSRVERLAWLAERLREIRGSGIIYALTIRDAHQVTEWLQSQGIHDVASYTRRSPDKPELENALLENRVKALVATTALSMGFDKPDLAFVIHYQTPGSVVHYYQQVGRAGRSLEAAYGILLSGVEETEITDYFIRNAFPTQEEVNQIITALEQHPAGLSLTEFMHEVNIRHKRVQLVIELLSLESPAPIASQGSSQKTKWQLTPAKLSEDFWARVERLTSVRQAEQRQMQEYVALDSGHMEFLIKALDGNPETVQVPDLPPLSSDVKPETVRLATEFLRRTNVDFDERKQWPNGEGIPVQLRAKAGKALCHWSDAGWGGLVQSGKYSENYFKDELVDASVQLIRKWNPQPTPVWVTCIPSLRHPDLVPDFAQRLATALGLPFHNLLVKTDDRPEQKKMQNSVQQAQNVEDSLALAHDRVLPGAVLLVDDIVDSRWTFTVAALMMREQGCSAVFPFALAFAGSE